MNEWINKMWKINRVGYYLPFKKNEILSYAAIYMNSADTMLSETNHSKEDRCCKIPLT